MICRDIHTGRGDLGVLDTPHPCWPCYTHVGRALPVDPTGGGGGGGGNQRLDQRSDRAWVSVRPGWIRKAGE